MTIKSRRPDVPTIIVYELTATGQRKQTPIFTMESGIRTFSRLETSHGIVKTLYVIRCRRKPSFRAETTDRLAKP